MIIEWQIDKPQEAIAFQHGLNRITIKSPFKAKGAKIDPFSSSCWLSRSLFPALKHQLTKVNRKGIPFRWVFYPTTEDKINNNLKLEDDEGEEEIEIRSRGGSFIKWHESDVKGRLCLFTLFLRFTFGRVIQLFFQLLAGHVPPCPPVCLVVSCLISSPFNVHLKQLREGVNEGPLASICLFVCLRTSVTRP